MTDVTVVVLTVLVLGLVLLAALLGVAALQRRRSGPAPVTRSPAGPALGSPAQVLLDRGERAGRRLAAATEGRPLVDGVTDHVAAVIAELRTAAARIAELDRARADLPEPALRAEHERLGTTLASAEGTEAEADLRAAQESVAARLTTVTRLKAARDAVLARMRAAVAGLEQAETEVAALAADLERPTGAALPSRSATVDLADRLAGLRAGLAEVAGLGTLEADSTDVDAAQRAGQGLPGDLPGSVEPPPRT